MPFKSNEKQFSFVLANDLIVESAAPLVLRSTGADPFLELVPADGYYPSGWVLMSTTMHRKGANFTSRLFFDRGYGFTESEMVLIPATRKGRVAHVFRLPRGVHALRWSPMRSEGVIGHSSMFITEVNGVERIARMFFWVAHDLWKFRQTQQASRHNLSISRLIFDLQGAYAASARLRFNFAPPSYATYLQQFDAVDSIDELAISRHIVSLKTRPMFSVWSIADEAVLENIEGSLTSLRSQSYPLWEFFLIVHSTLVDNLQLLLSRLRFEEARFSIIFWNSETSISEAVLQMTARTTGEYLIELDLNDKWSHHALYHVAVEIDRRPETDLLYADEDCLSLTEGRRAPYFKCDWNPDLFYSRNIIGNFGVYRRSHVIQAGGIIGNYIGAYRLDLALRCVARIFPENIRHIPFVLCHRGAAAEWDVALPFAADVRGPEALAAMQAHFGTHSGVQVDRGELWRTFRLHYPIPNPLPLVSILIPTRDAVQILRSCVESIRANTSYPRWEIIILDNQSEDKDALGYLAEIEHDSRISIVRYNLPFNYSAINNFGVAFAKGELICLLNNDTEVISANWLGEMVSHAVRPGIGAVGAKLLYSDGYVQHAGVVVGLGGLAGHVHRFIAGDDRGYAGLAQLTQSFSAVTAACLVMRRELFLAVGGLDEINLTVAYNDVDLCLRIRDAGLRNLWTPYALLYHHESYSRGDDQESAQKRVRFNAEKKYMHQRWKTHIVPDPFYSLNLTTDKEDCSITYTPRVQKPWAAYRRKKFTWFEKHSCEFR